MLVLFSQALHEGADTFWYEWSYDQSIALKKLLPDWETNDYHIWSSLYDMNNASMYKGMDHK